MRSPIQEITVPAAGESTTKAVTGKSILVLQAAPFEAVEDAALISFDNNGLYLPLVDQSRWGNGGCRFEEITVTGTAESAGTTVKILAVPDCVEPELGGAVKAKSGNTFIKSWSGQADTVLGFSELELIDSAGNLPRSVYIEATGADILYRSNDGGGSNPAADGDESFLLPADTGDQREILGIDFILNAKFVNAVAGQTPKMIVWPRY